MSLAPSTSSKEANGCPYHNSAQKTARIPDREIRPISQSIDGTWHIRSFDATKQILRGSSTKQAGFQAEALGDAMKMMRDPMLYLEGKEHHALRRETAHFFTPKAVRAYDDMIIAYVDSLLAELRQQKRLDLSDMSMKLAVRVAAQVVGLTNSDTDGMAQRISKFFEMEPLDGTVDWSVGSVKRMVEAQFYTSHFYLRDVRPALKTRREQRQDDLISHLIDQDYKNMEIMTECVTFGAAGMVTTREFIAAAAWHLLEDGQLRADYLSAETNQRHEILHEILRLEPVVGNLMRRTTEAIELTIDDETVTIPAGELINLHIYAANADSSVMGEPTDIVCTGRDLPRGVQSFGMSFGDGFHRCPGAYIAIEESDIFLTRFLKMDGVRIEQTPTVTWNEIVKGYELRDFIVAVA